MITINPFILLLIIIFFPILLPGAVIAWIVVHGHRQSFEESWGWQMNNVSGIDWVRREFFKDYTVSDDDGYTYHVSLLSAAPPTNKFVIFAHGYTDTRFGMLKYLPHYRRLGFNCIFFDERGHGENKRVPCSYGVKEVKGLLAVIDDTKKRYGNIKLGIHGESLGGATVLFSLKYDLKGKVDFVVDDCGFCDIVPVLKSAMRNTRVPPFFVYPASLMAKLIYGTSFSEAKPLNAVLNSKNDIPLLIMHGGSDSFIPYWHSEKVNSAYKSYHELHIFNGAEHAVSSIHNSDEYFNVLESFINNHVY